MTEYGMLQTLEYMIAMYESTDNKEEKRSIRYIINEFHFNAMPETTEGDEKYWELLKKADITE